ncbi:MAG: hypothetical protein IJZ95_00320 [Oscillospiraceae bacterium]|nr:hypothetical protein [Oscillospiraceae bacterium]
MDILFEFIIELILEGTIELSKSIKVPKFIRYPLIVIIALLFIGVIGIIMFAGIVSFQQNLILGIVLIALALLMLIMGISKFRKTYLSKKNDLH